MLINDETLAQLQSEFDPMIVPAQTNPAVALCCRAALLADGEARRQGCSYAVARTRAARSFRLALPPLVGGANVRDFIACITHGMLLGLIKPREGTRLIYAAQVAYTTRLSRTEKRKSQKASSRRQKASSQPQFTSQDTKNQ